MGLYHFVVTLFDQFHGLDKMAAAVEFERVPVGSPPLCCFYCCSPRFRPTRSVGLSTSGLDAKEYHFFYSSHVHTVSQPIPIIIL